MGKLEEDLQKLPHASAALIILKKKEKKKTRVMPNVIENYSL